ncbi:hypothetical protein CDAR_592591 [Caerostris darwini]|uniref:Uncharacterized protein n=1 Tax=Caerostris darwini TaxID=1538125 RepID=A0AAV4QGD5_9ARAC|nr:hypothetical protein CDAR_592591 [Caerostris darwini]
MNRYQKRRPNSSYLEWSDPIFPLVLYSEFYVSPLCVREKLILVIEVPPKSSSDGWVRLSHYRNGSSGGQPFPHRDCTITKAFLPSTGFIWLKGGSVTSSDGGGTWLISDNCD